MVNPGSVRSSSAPSIETSPGECCEAPRLELRPLLQLRHALFDVRASDSRRSIQPKAFAAETCHHTSVNHRTANIRVHGAPRGGKIDHQAPNKTVPGAGRIDDLVQGERRANEPPLRA